MMQYLNHDESHQLNSIKHLLQQIFQGQLYAIYLYGSCVDGGLKHKSDLDILVIIQRPITDAERKQLAQAFLHISVPVGHATARALEITLLDQAMLMSQQQPYAYVLQYGEWLRKELNEGATLTSQYDPDINILLRKAQLHHFTVIGPELNQWLAPISDEQIKYAIQQIYPSIIKHWKDDQDELNQILALCRIAYTLNQHSIAAKDIAATWFLQFLSQTDQATLQLIIDAYRCQADEPHWPDLHTKLDKIVYALEQYIQPLLFIHE
jgi:streptomycin 3"-adenylyltransferase